MTVFAIALIEPHPGVAKLIETNYPKYYEYSPTLYFVAADALAETVAAKVGIKGGGRVQEVSGFVIKLEEFSYSGYTSRSLWDWLKSVEKRT